MTEEEPSIFFVSIFLCSFFISVEDTTKGWASTPPLFHFSFSPHVVITVCDFFSQQNLLE